MVDGGGRVANFLFTCLKHAVSSDEEIPTAAGYATAGRLVEETSSSGVWHAQWAGHGIVRGGTTAVGGG